MVSKQILFISSFSMLIGFFFFFLRKEGDFLAIISLKLHVYIFFDHFFSNKVVISYKFEFSFVFS